MITFPDPRAVTIDVLRVELPALVPGTTVGTVAPDPARPDVAVPPHVMVGTDGAFHQRGLQRTASVRLVGYGTTEAEGYRLVDLALGIMRATSNGPIRGASYLTGPYVTTDPDTQLPITAATIAVRLHPINS